MAENPQYVTLGVANELFAAPVERVQEILEMRPIARLPRAPANLLGMIDVRSQSIPVIDLRATLDLPPAEDTPNTRIVVLWIKAADRDLTIGLKADRVFEVTVLDEPSLDPAPDVGISWGSDAIAGIGRRNGAFVTVFDLDRLFSADLAALRAGADRAA
jgi:purine-binding chemotaxis protein CheW